RLSDSAKAEATGANTACAPLLKYPTTGIGCCCARAASGHVATAPPSSVMNSRRLIFALTQLPRRQSQATTGTVRPSILAVSALARPFAAPPKNKSGRAALPGPLAFCFLHLAFWLRLSFARDALVHL